jgi:hypothetical protein
LRSPNLNPVAERFVLSTDFHGFKSP